jgi:hypothetical protein
MPGENDETNATGGGEGTGTPAIPPVITPTPKKADPPAALAKDDAVIVGADDEIPDEASLLKLTPGALNKRLERFSKRQLMDRFGTDDPGRIKADLDELQTLRAEKETARRAALSEKEKLEDDLRLANEAREKAEKKLQRAQDQQVFTEYDRSAEGVLSKHIDPESMELAVMKLKKHVLSLDDDELAKPEKVFEEWAAEFAKKNPRHARASDEKPAKRIPLNTGASPRERPAPLNPEVTQKTARPGQPNSMSKAEYAAFKRQHGLS